MKTLTKEQIAEIADQLDSGFACHINKQTQDLLFTPEPEMYHDTELDPWKSDLKKLRKNPDLYITIGPPGSRDSFRIMSQFVETLPDDSRLKDRLIQALAKRYPFREFKYVIDDSGDFRQMWFDFKSGKLQAWVEDELAHSDD